MSPDRPGSRSSRRGVVLGATADEGRVRATRQVLEVVDQGTGLGAAVVDRLCAEDVEGLVDPTGRPPVEVRTLRVTLQPRTDVEGRDVAARPPAYGSAVQEVRLDVAGSVEGLHIAHDTVAAQVLAHVTHAQLERPAPDVHLHGGGVVDGEGRAAVLLAPSGAGKSTLVAHLVHRGLGLLNDEQVAVLPGLGLVAGFTRPVAVKAGGVAHLPDRARAAHAGEEGAVLVTARELGGRHRLVGAPALVVLPERDPDQDVAWDLLDPVEGLQALCANNLDLVRKPRAGLEALVELATTVPVVWVRYPDAATGAAAVAALLADPPAIEAATATVHDDGAPPGPPGPPGPPAGDAPALRPAPGTLRATVGGHELLFHPDSRALVRLDADGAVAWRALLAGDAIAGDAIEPRLAARLVEWGLLVGEPPAPPARGWRALSRRLRRRAR